MPLVDVKDPAVTAAMLNMKNAGSGLMLAVYNHLKRHDPGRSDLIRNALQSGQSEIRITAIYTDPSMGRCDLEMKLERVTGETEVIGRFTQI